SRTAGWNVPQKGLASEEVFRVGTAAGDPLDGTRATRRGAPGGNEQVCEGLFHREGESGSGGPATRPAGNRLPPSPFLVYAWTSRADAKFRDFSVETAGLPRTLTDGGVRRSRPHPGGAAPRALIRRPQESIMVRGYGRRGWAVWAALVVLGVGAGR